MTAAEIKVASDYLTKHDPRVRPLIQRIELPPIGPSDPWWELVDSIVSQQLSIKAAATILGRLEALLPERPQPADLLNVPPETLRGAGLSNAKVRYVRDLAAKVLGGTVELERLAELPDEEVITELISVSGIGRWTAEMFLIFHLGRPDVLPVDDLGFREAVRRVYELSARPDAATLTELGEPWRPYRSVATRYLWKSLTLEVSTDARARTTPTQAD